MLEIMCMFICILQTGAEQADTLPAQLHAGSMQAPEYRFLP